MKSRFCYCKLLVLAVLALFASQPLFAQTMPGAPRQQKLLNGLNVLIWSEPQAEKVTLKLRIHSGAAFDPKDKMGVMALIADGFFPTEQSRNYFAEDLEGSLNVSSNYDFIEITATGKTEELVSMLETVATAVTNKQTLRDNFKAIQEARLAKVKQLETEATYSADAAARQRLFGEFPYGRSAEGTTVSLARIDVNDLLFARDRFLTPDNATLAITGNIRPETAFRAARQLFGAWSKADKKVPATFRLPDAPDTSLLTVGADQAATTEIRRAWRTVARSDKDFYAAQILAKVWQKRLGTSGQIEFSAHQLPGSMTLSVSEPAQTAPPVANSTLLPSAVAAAMDAAPNAAEFDAAKAEILNAFAGNHISDLWLDVDTYKLKSVKDELQNIQNVTMTDVARVAENMKKEPVVTVFLTKAPTAAAQK